MKFKKIFQKAAAVVMAAVTVFSVLPATTAFAAVGDVGTISFSHTYDGNGNAMRYNSSANINGYIAGGTGNYKYRTKAKLPTHTEVKDFDKLDKDSIILLEQIRTIDKQRLKQYIGMMPDHIMARVDKALAISLAMNGEGCFDGAK